MDAFLYIPRLLKPILSTCGFLWFLLILVGVYLLSSKKNRKLGFFCLSLSLFMTLTGAYPLPAILLGSLEKPYQNVRLEELPRCDVVLLLGGGQSYSEHLPFHVELNEAGDRVIGAFEAMRQQKADTLVTSSGYFHRNGEKIAHSYSLTNWIAGWNLFEEQVISLGPRKNTWDEAITFKKLAQEHGWQKIMLVTSAFHMRRSVVTFEKMGFEVVPYPVDFYVVGIPELRHQRSFVPDTERFQFFDIWFKEYTGYWLYKLGSLWERKNE
ncbi:MAG: YdcF family protein [Limisphaerales bacterium]|jgi:uncharacterized SAM-binding protein YcdF (DUF218 family)|nr:YdcF family protein [Verrucomicrobiota bacterium]